MVLSWNSWNWPLTKRSTKLDLPTADSPSSTSLNWQILFATAAPLGLVVPPPRPAIDRDRDCYGRDGLKLQVDEVYKQEPSQDTQALMVTPGEKNRIGRAVGEVTQSTLKNKNMGNQWIYLLEHLHKIKLETVIE